MDIDDPRIVGANQTFEQIKKDLLSSFKFFLCYAYSRMNNGDHLIWPWPPGRENHIIQIINVLEAAALGKSLFQTINIPSRYGKTLLIIYWIAWCYANRPNANFIYFSHTVTLAAEQTESVLRIIQSPWYKSFFDVRVSRSSSAKGNFKTTLGGHTIAVGADGAGIGRGAGLVENVTHAGALVMDDVLKTEEAFSAAAIRRICRVYKMTWKNRRNNPNMTPTINMGQRTGRNDLTGNLHGEKGNAPLDGERIGKLWRDNALIIPALDGCDNALWPEKHTAEWLKELREHDPYTFYSIYQQSPISSGNRIFKTELIKELATEPDFVCTFITGDTAETAKSHNDATAFSFWGLYEIKIGKEKTGLLGLHSINILEIRVEPEDLESEFEYFHIGCMRHKTKPSQAFIEEASTGVTLISVMKNKPGLLVVPIKRTAASGSKINRFTKTAPFIAKGQVSILRDAPHKARFKEHLDLITFDGAHKHDDIADTYSDAVDVGLIDQVLYNVSSDTSANDASEQLIAHNRLIISQTTGRTFRP